MNTGPAWYFELQGAETNNKGSHLMALSVLKQFQRWSENTHGGNLYACVYPRSIPSAWKADPLPVLRVFAKETSSASRRIRLKRQARHLLLEAALTTRELRRYGLIPRSQIDGMLDVSGYAYGDPWPRSIARVRVAEQYAKAGKPLVLLPQMLGPFTTPRARDEFRRLCDSSRLIFARDRLSLEHARAIVPDPQKIVQAPDITIGFACAEPPLGFEARIGVMIVPNDKILTRTGDEWGSSYVERLTSLVRHLLDRGESVTVLLHESGLGDRTLAKTIASSAANGNVPVITLDDPVELKHRLARARVVVGSRFHSLVSALSSGTPSVALGWAHKYEMLQSDFGVPALQHRAADPSTHLVDLVDSLLTASEWQKTQDTILARRSLLTQELQDMWPRVATALEPWALQHWSV